MRLSDWARIQGVHYQTAWKWANEGKMPVPVVKTPTGRYLVLMGNVSAGGGVALYARVSSADQKPDLDRQVARLTEWATGNTLAVTRVVSEVGSALNGARPQLQRLLADPDVAVIVVEHRDRLARFGVEYIEAALARNRATKALAAAREDCA